MARIAGSPISKRSQTASRSPDALSTVVIGDLKYQAVKFLPHYDLTREPAAGPSVRREFEGRIFNVIRFADGFDPCLIDVCMTRTARAAATTYREYPRDPGSHRSFHH